MRRVEIAVIGAGVIGLSIAHRLSAEGRDVVLIDPALPGSGASYGNAGTIATYAVQPVGTPDTLKSLPSLLFNRTSPLALRHTSLPALVPWLFRFVRQSFPRQARQNAMALVALLTDAGHLWRDLAKDIGAESLLRDQGCLHIYTTEKAIEAARSDMAFRRECGIDVDILDAAQVATLEPTLPEVSGGAFFPGVLSLSDPGQMMEFLVRSAGAEHIQTKATSLSPSTDGVTITSDRQNLHARKVVIAAGAHSKPLARQAGHHIPLDTERGYHLEWDGQAQGLKRPVSMTSRGFYLCPMEGRLRVAGTVELGGLHAPPSLHREKKLLEGAKTIFPNLGAPSRSWMGFRPSIPDSLPVIGTSKKCANILFAFGHGHIGLTLAPKTAQIIADLVAERPTSLDITPYSPSRF